MCRNKQLPVSGMRSVPVHCALTTSLAFLQCPSAVRLCPLGADTHDFKSSNVAHVSIRWITLDALRV